MGIGRKEFLRLAGLALAGLAVDPLKAVAVHENAYVNKQLGILFYKPRDWAFMAVKDFGNLKSKQVTGKGTDAAAGDIWNELGDPVCLITKYSPDKLEYKGVFSPTITLNVTSKDALKQYDYDSFEELIGLSHYGTTRLLKDFKVTKSYDPYYISDCRFFEFDAEYMFEHTEIEQPLKVDLKALKAEHNGNYYDFNCHQSKAQNQKAGKEFDDFKATIKLV